MQDIRRAIVQTTPPCGRVDGIGAGWFWRYEIKYLTHLYAPAMVHSSTHTHTGVRAMMTTIETIHTALIAGLAIAIIAYLAYNIYIVGV